MTLGWSYSEILDRAQVALDRTEAAANEADRLAGDDPALRDIAVRATTCVSSAAEAVRVVTEDRTFAAGYLLVLEGFACRAEAFRDAIGTVRESQRLGV